MGINLRPLHDRVLVKRIQEKEQVRGGIIIPDTAKEKPQEGEVVAVGQGKVFDNGTRAEMAVKPGDHVLFGKYAGTDVPILKVDGEEFLIMREEEIFGVVEGASKSQGA